MLIGVRQRGQPRPWLCTSLAHDSQKRHQRDACITRCYKTHIAEVNTAAASADTVVGVPASSLVSSSFWCCILSSGASVTSSSSASEWLSIFSEPTVWLTACRNCSRAYAWLSNLCEHICMCLSFVRLTCFLARLMARPRVTLLTSDTLSMVSSNVTGRLACELRLARTTQESHDSHISSAALEYFSYGFPYFVAPAFSTPAFSTPAICSRIFYSCIFHSRIFSAPINFIK